MNSIVGPIFNENFVEKNFSRSREQYIGSIGKHCSPLILLVKEVVGPVHNARDPLTDNILALLKKKKKKRRKTKTQTQHQKRVSKRILNGLTSEGGD